MFRKTTTLLCLLMSTAMLCAQQFDLNDIKYVLWTEEHAYPARWVTTGDTLETFVAENGGIVYKIDGYYVMSEEVSQDLWHYHMGYNPSTVKGDLLPVTNVTAEAIDSFCTYLSERTGFEWRLPTLAVWSLAYHGGIFSEGYRYCGSNRAEWSGWTRENSGGVPHAISQKIANEVFMYDMMGNVAERVIDNGKVCFVGGSFADPAATTITRTDEERPDEQGFRLVVHMPMTFMDTGI